MLYGLRAFYLIVHFLAVCTYALIYCLFFPRRLNNTSKLAAYMSWALPLLGIRLIHKNAPPLTEQQPAIYVLNHQDVLDIFIYTHMLPRNIAILGKSSLRFVPIFGLAYWLAGNIFINRKNKEKAWDTMQRVAATIQQRGCSVYMFPEGTRSKGRGLLPFKMGAFNLAVQSGLPIVPIVFSSTHKNISLKRWRGNLAIGQFLDPIATEGLTEQDVKPLMEQVRSTMLHAIDQLDQEVAALKQTDS